MHRQLAFAACLSAVMMVLALSAGSLLAAPMAIAFAVTGFWWHVTRPIPAGPLPPALVGGLCRGCARGCVECRERIDA